MIRGNSKFPTLTLTYNSIDLQISLLKKAETSSYFGRIYHILSLNHAHTHYQSDFYKYSGDAGKVSKVSLTKFLFG